MGKRGPKSVPRPIRIEGDVAYVALTRGYEAVVDAADAALTGRYNWQAAVRSTGVYAFRTPYVDGRRTTVLLHREILGFPEEEVDHRDRDGLNCRRSNLREATHQQNMCNKIGPGNLTGFKGVARNKGRFSAKICALGVRHHLGTFDTPGEAHAVYAAAAKILHGEFSRAA